MKSRLTVDERQIAVLASAALASSVVVLAGFLLFAYSIATASVFGGIAAGSLLALVLAQVHYLNVVHRKPRSIRLRIWCWSLAAHFAVLAIAFAVVRNSVVLVLLIPEWFSAALHVVGLTLAARTSVSNEPLSKLGT